MPKEKLPRLTEAQVRRLVSAQSFERGESYYRSGAILDPVRQGLELRAQCAGSEHEPYEVSATLGENSVAETSCTCPYDWGGVCKHIVALLLTYVHEPQSFRVIPPLETMLGGRSKEELIELIGEIVKRDPKVISAVELASAAPKPGKSMNVSAYRAQARRAMRSESPRTMEKELKALRDAAARLAKASDWLNAGAIYHVALEEAVLGYDDLVQQMDEEGGICVVMDELAEGLSKCLEKGQADSKTRRAWLETLLEAELKDIELGGIDLAPNAGKAVLKLANDEEWEWIEERLRTEAAQSRDWRRESLVGFLTEGLDRRKLTDEADELIRDLGTPEQQAHLLISEGKTDEALRQIKRIIAGKPGLVTEFADALVQAGAKKEALALVMENGGNHWMARDWLAKYYRKHGTPQEAAEAQREVFLGSPSVEAYKTLREASRKAGSWEQVRASVLAEMERRKGFGTLIEIALHEKDVPRALELLPQARGGWMDHRTTVAEAAEKDYPEAALAIWQEQVQEILDRRQRSSYGWAAERVKRMKRLFQRLGREADWSSYVEQLRSKYVALRAWQEEMRRARL